MTDQGKDCECAAHAALGRARELIREVNGGLLMHAGFCDGRKDFGYAAAFREYAKRLGELDLAASPPTPSTPASAGGADGASAWQPIDTAPKDGTRALIVQTYDDRPPQTTIANYTEWYQGGRCWQEDDGSAAGPTHWMPLPDPPSARAAEATAPSGEEPST